VKIHIDSMIIVSLFALSIQEEFLTKEQ